jgi:hypothetical protein
MNVILNPTEQFVAFPTALDYFLVYFQRNFDDTGFGLVKQPRPELRYLADSIVRIGRSNEDVCAEEV